MAEITAPVHPARMDAHSPPGQVFALNLSGLMVPQVTAWSVRRGEAIAGIGALKVPGDATGDSKSMRTDPCHRHTGAGAALLDHVIAEARRRLSPETGSGPAFAPAPARYCLRGCTDAEAFAGFARSAFNQLLHLAL